jgi:hypothetical protein
VTRKKTSIVRVAMGYDAVLADVVALIDAGRRAAVRTSNTRGPEVHRDGWNSHESILGRTLPAAPYILNSTDNRRTATAFDHHVWERTFEAVFGGTRPSFKWWDAHHYIVATMLVHALSQGDL